MITETVTLPSPAPGTEHRLVVHRFGPAGGRPRIHVQAALHADEIPGMICAVQLGAALRRLEDEGRIRGEIVLVPVANPLGLSQTVLGNPVGRFALADGGNFNRDFPDLVDAVAARVEGRLTADAGGNVAAIREALRAEVEAVPAATPVQALKKALARLAVEADLVLDLHCDAEAVTHLYTLTPSAETFRPLGAWLGAEAILLADRSGGDPFDEMVSRPWAELAARFPGFPIPLAGQSVTVELRGQADVDLALAEADAAAIVAFLAHAGAIDGPPAPLPAERARPTRLECSEPLVADRAGILAYRVPVGRRVAVGDPVADIIDPITGETTVVASRSAGVFYARAATRFAVPGKRLGKIAGTEVRRTGRLLSP